MSGRVIVVLGEGPHEIGRAGGQVAREALAALPCLVHRLLGEPQDVSYREGVLRYEAHVHGSGYKTKVQAAMRIARNRGEAGLALVVDRDGRSNRKRLAHLQEGRDTMSATLGVACAVGVAIEAFDAWMIADADAMTKAVGGTKVEAHRDPESLGAARKGEGKDYARQQLGDGLAEKYAGVAANVDLSLLERKCSKGFQPFAQEVRERLGPVVGSA